MYRYWYWYRFWYSTTYVHTPGTSTAVLVCVSTCWYFSHILRWLSCCRPVGCQLSRFNKYVVLF
jgi:hypothetical protein